MVVTLPDAVFVQWIEWQTTFWNIDARENPVR